MKKTSQKKTYKIIRKIQIKPAVGYHFISTRIVNIKMNVNHVCW